MNRKQCYLVQPAEGATANLSSLLQQCGYSVEVLVGVAWRRLNILSSGVVAVDGRLLESPQWPEIRLNLGRMSRQYCVLAETLTTRAVVRAMRDGAYEVVLIRDGSEALDAALEATRAAELLWQRVHVVEESGGVGGLLIGNSQVMVALRRTVEQIGRTLASVLITGESGTGKERIAQALHVSSRRGRIVALNCAAIPRELLEAELFGAVRGAYTGAAADRQGLVEQAAGGTLFLDEIGELDLSLQPKLLRFLETRKARRVGSNQEYSVDVRVLAATNLNLGDSVAQGKFREDLYYRLAEVVVESPPLIARVDDIPLLVSCFVEEAARRHDRVIGGVEPGLLEKFMRYHWPGNVRELRNTVERLVILNPGTVLGAGLWDPPAEFIRRDLHPATQIRTVAVMGQAQAPEPLWPPAPQISPASLPRAKRRELALKLIEDSGGDLSWVARQLGIHPTTLYRWRQKGDRP